MDWLFASTDFPLAVTMVKLALAFWSRLQWWKLRRLALLGLLDCGRIFLGEFVRFDLGIDGYYQGVCPVAGTCFVHYSREVFFLGYLRGFFGRFRCSKLAGFLGFLSSNDRAQGCPLRAAQGIVAVLGPMHGVLEGWLLGRLVGQ
ncbi:hypothetical protein HOV93_51670 [Planctomycetes bacterium FF15]|uniref:Uncharacterized protein n=1 Tax=Bremerella alba TaxID=980252 RepID=A0A7V8VAG8_9BACT|nr:hypothetical protein [Bremerella alba]